MVVILCYEQDIVQGHLCTKCGLRWGDEICLNGECRIGTGQRFKCPVCEPTDCGRLLYDRPGKWWYIHNGQKVDEFEAWVLKTRGKHGKTKRRS